MDGPIRFRHGRSCQGRLTTERRSPRRSARVAAVCWVLGWSSPAVAADFCVSTPAALAAALEAASLNGVDDQIRVQTGSYPVPPDGFEYRPPGGEPPQDLRISGGWQPGLGLNCLFNSRDPHDTVLDADGQGRVMEISALIGDSAVSVRLLRFEDGSIQGSGGGLVIAGFPSFTGEVIVERNAFIGNTANQGGGLLLDFGSTSSMGALSLGVYGNLFRHNHAYFYGGAAWLRSNGSGAGALVSVLNNTVVDNTHGSGNAHDAAGIYVNGDTSRVFVANNLMWGNRGLYATELVLDLRVAGEVGDYALHHNNIGVRHGLQPDSMSGNLSVEPVYAFCEGGLCVGPRKFVPRSSSPLVDGGMDPDAAAWVFFGFTPAFDFTGAPRVAGARIDIGAYENQDQLFGDGFES